MTMNMPLCMVRLPNCMPNVHAHARARAGVCTYVCALMRVRAHACVRTTYYEMRVLRMGGRILWASESVAGDLPNSKLNGRDFWFL